jgi:hypothetical protein
MVCIDGVHGMATFPCGWAQQFDGFFHFFFSPSPVLVAVLTLFNDGF